MKIHNWDYNILNQKYDKLLNCDVKNQLIHHSIQHFENINTHSQSKIDHLSLQCDSNKMKILCLSLIKNEYDAMINNPEYSYYNSLPTIFIMLRIEQNTIQSINNLINLQNFFNPVNCVNDIIELIACTESFKTELTNIQNTILELEQSINANNQTINNFKNYLLIYYKLTNLPDNTQSIYK